MRKRTVAAIASASVFVLGVIATPIIGRYVPFLADLTDKTLHADPLVLLQLWPATEGCDPSTAAAMPPGGARIDDLTFAFDEDRTAKAVASGAGAWQRGQLTLKLRTRDSSVVHVDDLQVIVLKKTAPRADWILATGEGQCGGGNDREYFLNLDESTLIRTKTDGAAEQKSGEGLDTNVEASGDDPARIILNVASCRASYEFLIRIQYSYGGISGTRDIGSPEQPLKVVGAAPGVPVYYVPLGSDRAVPVRAKKDTANELGPRTTATKC